MYYACILYISVHTHALMLVIFTCPFVENPSFPNKWTRPQLDDGLLPAHANSFEIIACVYRRLCVPLCVCNRVHVCAFLSVTTSLVLHICLYVSHNLVLTSGPVSADRPRSEAPRGSAKARILMPSGGSTPRGPAHGIGMCLCVCVCFSLYCSAYAHPRLGQLCVRTNMEHVNR